ncbi:hypothetical protein DFH07DRAFT_1056782 [Mycena maculata]|uniref:Uncharacterized protein n=1 Tax=Mycena maculata TaxID=230809 RepID=A0AAD7K095_9AGAR|nr:hypothetical protein DFH07DRAFT_1056782 [Mycena maculata]
MTSDISDLEPKGMIVDGHYILRAAEVFNLLKYMWTGILLVTTREEYCGFQDGSVYNFGSISKALSSYAVMVSPGGTVSYDVLFNNIRALADEKAKHLGNPSIIETLQDVIRTHMTTLSDDIGNLKAWLDGMLKSLHDFEEQCKKDRLALTAREDTVKRDISGESGIIQTLLAAIKKDVADIADKHAQIELDEHLVKMTHDNPFSWVPFVGPALSIAGDIKYGAEINSLRSEISNLDKEITDDKAKIKEAKAIITDLSSVKMDIEGVQEKITVAIHAIEILMGVSSPVIWPTETMFTKKGGYDAMANGLKSLQNYVDRDVRTLAESLTDLVEKTLRHKWADLKEAALYGQGKGPCCSASGGLYRNAASCSIIILWMQSSVDILPS